MWGAHREKFTNKPWLSTVICVVKAVCGCVSVRTHTSVHVCKRTASCTYLYTYLPVGAEHRQWRGSRLVSHTSDRKLCEEKGAGTVSVPKHPGPGRPACVCQIIACMNTRNNLGWEGSMEVHHVEKRAGYPFQAAGKACLEGPSRVLCVTPLFVYWGYWENPSPPVRTLDCELPLGTGYARFSCSWHVAVVWCVNPNW